MTSLLPPNRSDLERILSETIAARFPRPIERIGSVFDADSCPVSLLPYLAWSLSIDLWDDRWDEVKKRNVCRNAFKLHAMKTTLAGIRAHVALTGAEVVKAIRPPATPFLHPAYTEDARRAWLDGLPQIRLYPFVHYGVVRKRSFYRATRARQWDGINFDSDGSWSFDGAHQLFDMAGADAPPYFRAAYIGHAFARADRGPVLQRIRATYWDRGDERDITLQVPAEGIARLLVPGSARRNYYGSAYIGATARTSRASAGIVTLRLSDDAGGYAVAAGLNPVDVRPTRISETRIAPAARAFFGRWGRGHFMRPTHAPNLVYDRVSLHAPDRMGARRRARSFYGHARFGMAPFTAELRIAVPMQRYRARDPRFYGRGYMRPADMRPLDRAVEAVRVSKAFRDKILIDTALHGRVQFGGGLRFGDFTFGEIRKVS